MTCAVTRSYEVTTEVTAEIYAKLRPLSSVRSDTCIGRGSVPLICAEVTAEITAEVTASVRSEEYLSEVTAEDTDFRSHRRSNSYFHTVGQCYKECSVGGSVEINLIS